MRPCGLAGALTRHELARHPLGHGRVDGQDVPVQRPSGGRAHLDEEVDLLVGELVQAARDDRFELGALVFGDGPRQREEFLRLRVAGGDRLAVAVGMGGRLGGGQPPRARVHRVV